jgi:hypothetical protein
LNSRYFFPCRSTAIVTLIVGFQSAERATVEVRQEIAAPPISEMSSPG